MEINTLKSRWLDLGLFPLQKEAEIAFDNICKLYNEKHRFYHTLKHISDCLSLFDRCVNYIEMPQELETAIWLHDVIYDPKKSNNEQLSADFAVELLSTIGAEPKKIHIINNLILCTKHPLIPTSNDEKYLTDIDLSILGADKETYAQYSKMIEKEYAYLPSQQYKDGRKNVLKTFIDSEYIYHTELFRSKYEKLARINLQNELISLGN